MKKILLVFLLGAMIFLSGCKKKSYSAYLITVPWESWIGGAESDYNVMFSFLVNEGFVSYINIEGDDVVVNDEAARRIYEQRLARLRQFDLKAVMVGSTSPGSISFNLELTTGSAGIVMNSEAFTVVF